jgi:hypothetical protein
MIVPVSCEVRSVKCDGARLVLFIADDGVLIVCVLFFDSTFYRAAHSHSGAVRNWFEQLLHDAHVLKSGPRR